VICRRRRLSFPRATRVFERTVGAKIPWRVLRPLHYLAISPSLFAPGADGLAQAGCAAAQQRRALSWKSRSGAHSASAKQYSSSILPKFVIQRIEHFLGKEPVQNILYTLFANLFLELSRAVFTSTRADHHGGEFRRHTGRGRFYVVYGLDSRVSGLSCATRQINADRSFTHDLRFFFATCSMAYNLVLRSVSQSEYSAW
jgi:hypothetical protein